MSYTISNLPDYRVETEAETAALAIYMCYILFIYSSSSSTHLRILPRSMHIHSPRLALYQLTLTVAVFILLLYKLYLNMCSAELPAGILAMNNVILTKWCIALSYSVAPIPHFTHYTGDAWAESINLFPQRTRNFLSTGSTNGL